MKRKLATAGWIVLCMGIILLGAACGGTAQLVKALSKDKASVCAEVKSLYGTGTIVRIGEGQTVRFGPNCSMPVGQQ